MAKYSRRPDGRYQYQMRVGYDANGRRVVKSFYGRTVAELEAKIRNARTEIGRAAGGAFVPDYARQYVETYKATKSENTRAMYERAIRYHVAPLFAGVRVRDLTAAEIQRAINSLADKRRTAEIVLTLLRQICTEATEGGILPFNPCRRVVLPPKPKKRERRPFCASEREILLQAPFDDREACLVFILYGCGLRREEALGLRLCDVDLAAGDVSVRQVVTFPENSPVIRQCGKTDRSIRTVPLPASLIERVRPWYKVRIMSGADPDSLLFPGISKTVYTRMWEKIRGKLGRPELTAYWFRHNYATMLYYSGISLKQAVVLLGHSNTKMLMDVYAHLDAEKENARGKLDRLFSD